MSNLIIDTVSSLSSFFIFTIIMTTITGLILAFFSKRVSMIKKNRNICQIFYGLTGKGKTLLATYYLRFLFVIFNVITISIYDNLYSFVFFFLSLIIMLLNFKKLFNNAFVIFVLYLCMETSNIIIMYNTQIYYYVVLEVIYWLLGVFIILFTLYDLIKNLEQVSKCRSDSYEKVSY